MVVVGGDRCDLGVGYRDLRIERGKFQMLLVLFRAIVAAREREDQRVLALYLAELTLRARVIGQFVVGENGSGHNLRTHSWTLLFSLTDLLLKIRCHALEWLGRARRLNSSPPSDPSFSTPSSIASAAMMA